LHCHRYAIAALFRAWTEFLILDGVDQFPLLASAWRRSSSPAPCCRRAPISDWLDRIPGARLFLVILARRIPNLDPKPYLFSSFIAITSVILLFVLLRTVTPDVRRASRRWY